MIRVIVINKLFFSCGEEVLKKSRIGEWKFFIYQSSGSNPDPLQVFIIRQTNITDKGKGFTIKVPN